MGMKFWVKSFFVLYLLFHFSCSHNRKNESPGSAVLGDVILAGSGYAHYHQYPDSGICYAGEVNFLNYNKMIAAVSPSIHSYFDEKMGERSYYVRVSLENSDHFVEVAAIDKGGVVTEDFNRREQHIMDLSEEAFDLLDIHGMGKAAGRLYVKWEIVEKGLRDSF